MNQNENNTPQCPFRFSLNFKRTLVAILAVATVFSIYIWSVANTPADPVPQITNHTQNAKPASTNY